MADNEDEEYGPVNGGWQWAAPGDSSSCRILTMNLNISKYNPSFSVTKI